MVCSIDNRVGGGGSATIIALAWQVVGGELIPGFLGWRSHDSGVSLQSEPTSVQEMILNHSQKRVKTTKPKEFSVDAVFPCSAH